MSIIKVNGVATYGKYEFNISMDVNVKWQFNVFCSKMGMSMDFNVLRVRWCGSIEFPLKPMAMYRCHISEGGKEGRSMRRDKERNPPRRFSNIADGNPRSRLLLVTCL